MDRSQRTVVVTGSASGMGDAVRHRLEQAGARVIGVDLRSAEVTSDLGDEKGRIAALEAMAELADGRIDGVVTCAGLGPHFKPTSDIARVNYFGTVVLVDALLPVLAQADSPAAVLFASNAASLTPRHDALLEELLRGDEESAAKLAESLDGITVYGMTKLALVRAMRDRVRTWGASGVRINAVAPGPIETPMLDGILADPGIGSVVEALPIPLARRGSPDEVAAAVDFLLGPDSRYVQGVVLFVDGGSDAELRRNAF